MISEDMTWKKRKIRWKRRKIVRVKKKEESRVWLRQEKIKIGEKWSWNEEKKDLKDEKGNLRGNDIGIKGREKKGGTERREEESKEMA